MLYETLQALQKDVADLGGRCVVLEANVAELLKRLDSRAIPVAGPREASEGRLLALQAAIVERVNAYWAQYKMPITLRVLTCLFNAKAKRLGGMEQVFMGIKDRPGAELMSHMSLLGTTLVFPGGVYRELTPAELNAFAEYGAGKRTRQKFHEEQELRHVIDEATREAIAKIEQEEKPA